MSNDNLLLLDFELSPFCARVKTALAEKKLSYKNQEENILGEKSELLKKSNPVYEKVPVLLHNGKPIVESTNIVYYLDEVFASPPLLPACPYGRSRARFWADFIDKKVFDAGSAIWRSAGGELEAAKKDFIDVLKMLEGALGDKPYFNGDTFGFVDIVLIGSASWFPAYEKYGGFKVKDENPKIGSWLKRCNERESVSNNSLDPQKLIEFVGMMRKMHCIE